MSPHTIQERDEAFQGFFELQWQGWTGTNSPDGDGDFSKAPILNFNDKLKFDTNDVSNANDNYGSASGFVPKSLIITMG